VKHLFILNDPPYGSERSYNGLRLARELLKDPAAGNEVKLFLIGDAASCAKAGQKVPQGYYSVEALLRGIAARSAATTQSGQPLPVLSTPAAASSTATLAMASFLEHSHTERMSASPAR
jgi:hypothetical protein